MDNNCNNLIEIETATAAIAQNLCNQVIAFQESISARPEGQRFPGSIEVALLCKLINCLDKIRRWIMQNNNNKEMNNFIRHLKNTDKDLGKVVAARYKEFKENSLQHNSAAPTTNNAVVDTSIPQAPVKTCSSNKPEKAYFVQDTSEEKWYVTATEVEQPIIATVPEGKENEPVAIPLLTAETDGKYYYYQPCNPGDPNSPEMIIGAFDDRITRQDLDENPITLLDYCIYWNNINEPCNFTDITFIRTSRRKLYLAQYQLRYIHYMLEVEQYYKQYPAKAA